MTTLKKWKEKVLVYCSSPQGGVSTSEVVQTNKVKTDYKFGVSQMVRQTDIQGDY